MARQTNRLRPIGTDGMTATERDITDRWDAGASIQRIIADTGQPKGTVERIVSTYAFADEDRLHRKALIASNTRFLDAIAATGRRFA